MKIQPLGTRVLLKPVEAQEKTKSGLYIPDSAKEKPLIAQVMAIGESELIKVKIGDKVIYESYGGSEVDMNGEKFKIMDMKDILAIVKE